MADQPSAPSPAEKLRTERLLLRAPTSDDIERIAHIANNKSVARNMSAAFPHPYSVEDAKAFVEATGTRYAIEPVDSTAPSRQRMVGIVGGSDIDDGQPGAPSGVHTFGYWLGEDAWGHGYATEAAAAYLDHIIALGTTRRIEASVYAWNPASVRVLEKLGFELEGRLRGRVVRFGDTTDELIYGRLIE